MGSEEDQSTTAARLSPFRYNSPLAQVGLIGLVCFCCPGMFNALSGMGGGGQVDPTAANNANTALYTTFAIFGVLGGGIYNLLGPRLTLLAGCSTYAIYAGSFLYYNHHNHQLFVIIAGGILGVGAGLLWAGQGAIMTSYPPSGRKGTYISLFWAIFNMGGVVGGFIPFVLNYHRTDAGSVNDGTYIVFMCFMAAGAVLSLAILPPSRVVRDDGTRASNMAYSSVRIESVEILKLFADWRMLLIVPAAWASNFFYSYQFNNVNGILFTLRTKGLNNVFYWGAQMLGSWAIGYVLDFSFKNRRTRGYVGIATVAVLGTGIWVGGLANQLRYTNGEWPDKLDFKDSGGKFAGPFVLYFSYGLLDAMFQTLCYWVIGALADDSQTLSRFSGFYKGVQSAGAAVAWQVDTHKTPLLSQLLVNWSLTTVSYPLLAVLVMLAVKNETAAEDGESKVSKPSATLPAENDAHEVSGKAAGTSCYFSVLYEDVVFLDLLDPISFTVIVIVIVKAFTYGYVDARVVRRASPPKDDGVVHRLVVAVGKRAHRGLVGAQQAVRVRHLLPLLPRRHCPLVLSGEHHNALVATVLPDEAPHAAGERRNHAADFVAVGACVDLVVPTGSHGG